MSDRVAKPDCFAVAAEVADISPDGHVELRIVPGAGCEGCTGACRWRGNRPLRFWPDARWSTLRRGSRIVIALPADIALRSALLLHGLPLCGLLCGAAVGSLAAASDAGALVGALLGLAGGLAAIAALRGALEARTLRELDIRTIE